MTFLLEAGFQVSDFPAGRYRTVGS